MQKPIVAKFGGSSLATAERLKLVHNIIRSNHRIKFVVVSAPGKEKSGDQKVTDLLLLAHEEEQRGVSFENTFKVISEKFSDLATNTSFDVTEGLVAIRNGIKAGNSLDWVASRGEWLSAQIVATSIGFDFVDAAGLIYFNSEGAFDEAGTWQNIQQNLDRPAVIPGFYGALPNGTIKTFPRGGSDITGAILAANVSAGAYLNYTDVLGFLTADPRVVPNSRQISRLTFREVRELSYAGAVILQSEAVLPARKANIPIQILSTFEPEKVGTTIYPDATLSQNTTKITGIAGRTGFTRITLEKAGMNEERGFLERATGVFSKFGISIEHTPSSVDSLSIIVAESQLDGNISDITKSLQIDCAPDAIEISKSEMALIAVVGKAATSEETILTIISALKDVSVSIKMINLGSSNLSVIIGVENRIFSHALRALHSALCTD